MATNPFNGFYEMSPEYPRGFNSSLSFVTPFTHRTNISYAELLFELYKWLREKHLPELDKILKEWQEQYKIDFDNLKEDIENTKIEWQTLFDQFMADVVNQLEALNDQAVSNLINDLQTLTGKALYDRYVEKNNSRIIAGDEAGVKLREHDIGSNGTVVALGRDAMGNMEQVKNSIAIGAHAMGDGTISRDNIAIGDEALRVVSSYSEDYVQENRNGTRNVAVGSLGGRMNLDGVGHVFIGRGAGASVEGGNGGVWIGAAASASSQPIGLSGEIENYNHAFPGNPEQPVHVVAVGRESMTQNSGRYNTAVGSGSLRNNTKGVWNVAIGSNALLNQENNTWYNGGVLTKLTINGRYSQVGNVLTLTLVDHPAVVGDWVSFRLLDGDSATFAGDYAFAVVTAVNGNDVSFHHPIARTAEGFCVTRDFINQVPQQRVEGNTAVGHASLGNNVSGAHNVAIGMEAGYGVVEGESNVAIGYRAGYYNNAGYNTLVGSAAGVKKIDNTNMTDFTNVICLGQGTAVSGASQAQIGNSTTNVYAYGAVQDRSDVRDKADVRDTVLGLEFINGLRPVDYKWNYRDDYSDFDSSSETKKRNRYHHGVIAQEVKQVADSLGVDFGGYQDHSINGGVDVKSIGYTELIAPLIKAVQELTQRVNELESK